MPSSHRIRLAAITAGLLVALAPAALAAAPDCTGISSVIPNDPNLIGDLTSIRVASGLFRPTHVAVAPGDDERMFIVEQRGTIRVLKNGALLATNFLNLTSIVRDSGNEEGLLSIAFHPDYQSNGMFWIYYTNNSSDNVVARYEVSANPDVADVGSGQVIFTMPHPGNTNHNGGQLAFSPEDGRLYVGSGDGGSGCDPGPGDGNGQNKNSLLGKIHRLNVTLGPTAGYTTEDNPYDGIIPGADEVWSYGIRNPWRFTFDRVTGNIYIGDVGQNFWEEIDCGQPPSRFGGGENYGWVFHEGNSCVNDSCGGSASDCNPPDYVAPIKDYSLSGSPCSVISGYVYRGCRMDPLHGSYFYSDYCAPALTASFRTDALCSVGPNIVRAGDLAPEPGNGTIGSITSYGEDNQGEVYIVDQGGEVFKIIPNFDIHEVSGERAYPFTFGTNWTFENLATNSDWSPDWYRVYRSTTGPTGPFTCKKLIRNSACLGTGESCTYAGGDTATPLLNNVYYYLVTAWLDEVEGRAGAQSDGTLRVVDSGSICPFP